MPSVTFVGIFPIAFATLSVTFPESPVTFDRNTQRHTTRIDGIAAALQALGKHLDMRVV